ncbi:MAG: Hsp70 family protein [Eubacteriaceae bacterium]|nr:Hsp70 family protein [Eubacteriaceae bacterium]
MKNYSIGIDIGSSKTAVAQVEIYEGGNRKIDFLGDSNGLPFSSMAALSPDGEFLFGSEVRDNRLELSQTHSIYSCIKEYLGTDASFPLQGTDLSPAQALGEYLKHVKGRIYELYSIDIQEAAFSISPDMPIQAREDIVSAARMAGIEASSLVYAPTALYLSCLSQTYGFARTLCVDWGGGEAVIGVFDKYKSELRELAVASERIGGLDADMELALRIHAKIISAKPELSVDSSFEDLAPYLAEELLTQSEKAKEKLGCELSISGYGPSAVKLSISARTIEEALAPFIYNRLLKALDKALDRAGANAAGIDAVILSGGFSQFRPVRAALEGIFGEEKIITPKSGAYSVAVGTAIADCIEPEGAMLAEDICVELSDGRLFSVLQAEESKAPDIPFGITKDVQEAAFHFYDSSGRHAYEMLWVDTKGFLNELLGLSARLTRYLTVEVIVRNPAIAQSYSVMSDLVNVTFRHDLEQILQGREV